MSRFSGHRIYNGCPDSELKAKWDAEASALEEVRKLNARHCYFPMEGMHSIYMTSTYQQLAWHEDKMTAILHALTKLREE